MAYVIAAPCIADYSCVEICPVDCIAPGPADPRYEEAEQLYIDPRACIDCNACVDVCPVDAIFKSESLPPNWAHYAAVNAAYFVERTE